jgi:hypothetical protein
LFLRQQVGTVVDTRGVVKRHAWAVNLTYGEELRECRDRSAHHLHELSQVLDKDLQASRLVARRPCDCRVGGCYSTRRLHRDMAIYVWRWRLTLRGALSGRVVAREVSDARAGDPAWNPVQSILVEGSPNEREDDAGRAGAVGDSARPALKELCGRSMAGLAADGWRRCHLGAGCA